MIKGKNGRLIHSNFGPEILPQAWTDQKPVEISSHLVGRLVGVTDAGIRPPAWKSVIRALVEVTSYHPGHSAETSNAILHLSQKLGIEFVPTSISRIKHVQTHDMQRLGPGEGMVALTNL